MSGTSSRIAIGALAALLVGLLARTVTLSGGASMLTEAVHPIPRSGTVPNTATDLTFGPRSARLILVNDSGMIEVPLARRRPEWSRGFAAPTPGFRLRGWAQEGGFDWVVDAASLTLRRNPGDVAVRLPADVRDPSGLASDGTSLWVADAATNRLYQFADPRAGMRFVRSAASGTAGPVRGVAFDGTALWATDGTTIYRYDGRGLPETMLSLDRHVDGITWHLGSLWASAFNQSSLLVLACPPGFRCPPT